MKTTVRSRRSQASAASRRTTSIRSLRRSQHSKKASDVQTNDFYVIGSMETATINFSVDKQKKCVKKRDSLN